MSPCESLEKSQTETSTKPGRKALLVTITTGSKNVVEIKVHQVNGSPNITFFKNFNNILEKIDCNNIETHTDFGKHYFDDVKL